MTKVYSGFEALERMKTHWIQKEDTPFNKYRFEDGVVKAKSLGAECYLDTHININLFFNNTFVDYVEPLAVGDTVKVKLLTGELFGEVGQVFDEWGKTWFRFKGNRANYNVENAVRIEEDELAALKRKATFEQKGRRVDEFRMGDIVEYKGVKAIVRSIQGLYLVLTGEYHGHVSAKDVTPYKFATYVDATAPAYVKVDPCTAPPMPGMGQPMAAPMGGQF